MKEATGELNMTVVTVVAIGAIIAIFTIFILPSIRENLKRKTYCSSAVCTGCTTDAATGARHCTDCKYIDENGAEQTTTCDFSN